MISEDSLCAFTSREFNEKPYMSASVQFWFVNFSEVSIMGISNNHLIRPTLQSSNIANVKMASD